MAGEPAGGAIMTRICWWLADILCRVLEPSEREAVRGDLAESGETGSQALRDVLGLVVRRQAAPWTDWRPWLTLMALVVPFGMLLCFVSRRIADRSAIYVWLYVNNWDWVLLGNAAFRHDLARYFAIVFIGYLTLFCWSWTSGFVFGSVSRRGIPVQGVLFGLLLFFGELPGGAPRYFGANTAVFELTFYRVMFPPIVQAVLVFVPSLWGMRQGMRVTSLRPVPRTIIWTAAIAALAAAGIQNWGLVAIPYSQPGVWDGRHIGLLQLVAYWPLVYLAASAIGRRWHKENCL